MFFANAGMFSFGFATHPPIDLRIRAIERDWDGKFPASGVPQPAAQAGHGAQNISQMHSAGPAAVRRTPPPLPAGLDGASTIQLATGAALFNSLREEWREAAHSAEGAQALIFGLLLASDPDRRATELGYLADQATSEIAEQAARWQREISPIQSAQKIALAEMSVAPLRRLISSDYAEFRRLTRWIIASDGQINLFEFMLQKLVERHLDSAHGLRPPTKIRHTQLRDLHAEILLLSSAMAALSGDPQSAYAAAMDEYQAHGGEALAMQVLPDINLAGISAALEKCDAATPLVKRQLLRLCSIAAASDGVLADHELELLRAIADAIGSPIPLAPAA